MPDEITNDDEPVIPEEKSTRPDNRFTQLSEKVKTTAEERDAANAAKAAAEKELEFYKGFSKVSAKPEYQAASEYQEKIKEKVLSGYEMEDATISVLGKAGKLGFTPTKKDSPAGGSATNTVTGDGEKTLAEMSRQEKRDKLMEFERETPGSLAQTLRSTNIG